jgi:hypothetical protein
LSDFLRGPNDLSPSTSQRAGNPYDLMGVRRCDERTGTRKEIPPYTRRPLPSSTSNSRVSASYPGISTPAGEDLIFGKGSGRGVLEGGVGEHGKRCPLAYGLRRCSTRDAHSAVSVVDVEARGVQLYISSTQWATALGGLVAYFVRTYSRIV